MGRGAEVAVWGAEGLLGRCVVLESVLGCPATCSLFSGTMRRTWSQLKVEHYRCKCLTSIHLRFFKELFRDSLNLTFHVLSAELDQGCVLNYQQRGQSDCRFSYQLHVWMLRPSDYRGGWGCALFGMQFCMDQNGQSWKQIPEIYTINIGLGIIRIYWLLYWFLF